jgi:hypothetical protein
MLDGMPVGAIEGSDISRNGDNRLGHFQSAERSIYLL